MQALVLALLTLAYPTLVYWGLGRFEPRHLAVLLLALALLRALATKQKYWWAAAGAATVLAALTWFGNDALPLKLYLVLVNAVMLLLFGLSLIYPPTVVERLARLKEPDLPASGVRYTRRVTQVWCVFFVLNGSLAIYTAVWASDAVWALYNGLVAYVLMGLLMVSEWLFRQRMRQRNG